MKTHITPKQAEEISEEHFYSFFDQLMPREDWATCYHKKMDLAMMLDFLDEVKVEKDSSKGKWNVTVDDRHYKRKNLVDALWAAMKDER